MLADGLLADLRHVVETDPCWHDGLVPAQFEWWFGGDATGRAAGNAAGNAPGDGGARSPRRDGQDQTGVNRDSV